MLSDRGRTEIGSLFSLEKLEQFKDFEFPNPSVHQQKLSQGAIEKIAQMVADLKGKISSGEITIDTEEMRKSIVSNFNQDNHLS